MPHNIHHRLNYNRYPFYFLYFMAKGGALEGLKEARECGLVDYIGISSHTVEVLRRAVESQEFDTIQMKYSPFKTAGEALVSLAQERDIGVIAMKPLGGFGMLGWLKSSRHARLLNAPTLLRYALSNRCLSVVIPGMRFLREVEENGDSIYVRLTGTEGEIVTLLVYDTRASRMLDPATVTIGANGEAETNIP